MPNTLPSSMISLSDEQMNSVMRAAEPLQPRDRGAFLEALAQALRGQRELGDGANYRAIREVQRKHFDPPHQIAGLNGDILIDFHFAPKSRKRTPDGCRRRWRRSRRQ